MGGKLSGYDAVAEYQSRLTQATFTTESARRAVLNEGSFSDQRLVDLGVKKLDGDKIVDSDLSMAYKKYVEFDEHGAIKDMHFAKWSDDEIREYTYMMNRYEAQVMPYIMAGELPQVMNIPEMQFALHYLKTPLAFGTKGTARQLGFADKEAAVAVTLNTMSAGLVRYAWTAGGGAAYSVMTGEDVDMTPNMRAMSVHNYLDWFGYLGEIYNKGNAVATTVTSGEPDPLIGALPPAVKQAMDILSMNPAAMYTLNPAVSVVSKAIMDSVTEEK